jgi:PilZ domain
VIEHVFPGQPAHVRLHQLGDFEGRVESASPERLKVAALHQVPNSATLVGTSADLDIGTPRGVIHTAGTILEAGADGVLDIGIDADLRLDQRRQFVRVAARVPGVVGQGGAGSPLHTYTLDVSAGGLLVAGAGDVEIGAPVSVTVKIPDRDPVEAAAVIARRTKQGHAALQFTDISEADREALIRWIFERQRLERQAAKGEH